MAHMVPTGVSLTASDVRYPLKHALAIVYLLLKSVYSDHLFSVIVSFTLLSILQILYIFWI